MKTNPQTTTKFGFVICMVGAALVVLPPLPFLFNRIYEMILSQQDRTTGLMLIGMILVGVGVGIIQWSLEGEGYGR